MVMNYTMCTDVFCGISFTTKPMVDDGFFWGCQCLITSVVLYFALVYVISSLPGLSGKETSRRGVNRWCKFPSCRPHPHYWILVGFLKGGGVLNGRGLPWKVWGFAINVNNIWLFGILHFFEVLWYNTGICFFCDLPPERFILFSRIAYLPQ